MPKPICLIVCVAVLCGGALTRAAQQDRVPALPKVPLAQLTDVQIADFLWSSREGEASRRTWTAMTGNVPANPYSIGDRQIVDLNGDGTTEIVATVSSTPRMVFNELIVISQERRGRRLYSFGAEALESLKGVIADLDGDGTQELVVPTEYERGSGQNFVIWPIVVNWKPGSGFVDHSEQFLQFYVARIPAAQREAAARQVAAKSNAEFSQELLASAEMVVDRLMRITGRAPDAPTRRALEWSGSPNPVLRQFAVTILATFPTAAGDSRLRELTNDVSPIVRERAKAALAVPRSVTP